MTASAAPAWHRMSAVAQGDAIARGEIDPRALCAHYLDRIAAAEGAEAIYLRTTRARAEAEAEAAAKRAADGRRASRLDGVPISWKDIFDTAGTATEMGTPLFAGRVPARDAEAVRRAARAGLVCLGKTNTVQFALGGIGSNPATGTPPNAAATDTPRAPGGSSSGAAVSVARRLAAAAIGSDTGGSVRIPAAWNRLVGLKTSVGAIPTGGVMPLAPTLDTVGPLCVDAADAAALFAVLAARPPVDLAGADAEGLRLLVAEDVVWDGAEPGIAAAVEGAVESLAAAGAAVERGPVPEFAEIDACLDRHGGLVTAEGYVQWREFIDRRPGAIDPNVLARFHQGRGMSAPDVETVRAAARRLAPALYRRMARYDAVLAPTAPIAPPPLADALADGAAYARANLLALRNTRIGNVLPCCALTLPCGAADLPAGLMAMAPAGEDARLLRVGAAIEAVLTPPSGGQNTP